MRTCGRKDYLLESPDPDAGVNWWWERTRTARSESDASPKSPPLRCVSLVQINDQLDRLHRQAAATETGFWQLLTEANRFQNSGQEVYWLTVMRIAELAILTAGAYADGCEFQMAGDLLTNPARVLIHLKDRKRPIVKRRHVPLSAALQKEVGAGLSFMDWFRRNVLLEMTCKALLPHLIDRLGACGSSAGESVGESVGDIDMGRFRERIETSMKKVADTIAFLAAWQIDDVTQLHARIEESSPETRRFIHANLCRFEDTHFIQIGATIRKLVTGGTPHNDVAAPHTSPVRSRSFDL
jgi:hypothetical protein